jgi:hypothetical protein
MFYLLKNPKTISELVSICDTTRKLLWWMKLHIRHREDLDTIQSPDITLEKRKGSNLEFAWLFYDALLEMGINCYIITVKGNSDSVASFLEVENEKLRCVVNRCTMLGYYDTINAAIDHIDIDWYRWIEWAVICGGLVPIKPHYRNGDHGEDTDTRNYLLRNRLSSM